MIVQLLTWQPFKATFIAWSTAYLWFVRVPIWTLTNLFPSWRPRSTWSLRRTLQVKIFKFQNWVDHVVGTMNAGPDHRALRLGRGVRGLYVDGVPKLVTGDLKRWADFAGVEPTRIPGYWIHKQGSVLTTGEKPAPGEKVLYFLHGGGYVVLSAHPHSPVATVNRAVLNVCHDLKRSFAIEYRLSSTDPGPRENPFPAAILDALAGYYYLVHGLHFHPENVIVVGDSAGGNLALALIRYLVQNQGTPGLPAPPGAQILLSPWTDMGSSHCTPDATMHTLVETDFLNEPQADESQGYAPRAYLGRHGLKFADACEYLSPASKHIKSVSFKGFPPTLIVSGGAEIFLDQIRELYDRMKVDIDSYVAYHEEKDAFHDVLGFPWFEPERSNVQKAVSNFVHTLQFIEGKMLPN